jgi:hypothetical protein
MRMRKEKGGRERVKTDGNEQAAFSGGLQLIEVQLAELSVDLFLMAANVHYCTWEILRWLCNASIFLFIGKSDGLNLFFPCFRIYIILTLCYKTQLIPASPTAEVFFSKAITVIRPAC